MKLYWEALTRSTQDLYALISKLPFISEFYLGGGTGLALQLGHRLSGDLDFFSDSSVALGKSQRMSITDLLKEDPQFKIYIDQDDTFVANWKDVGVSFFRLDQHPLIKPARLIKNVRVAVTEEIGAMKLAAILSRGTRKDYIDLYFILQQTSLDHLFKVAAIKYPNHSAFATFAIRALAYFEDAEFDPMPRMIQQVDWNVIKKDLTRIAIDIGKRKLDLDQLWTKI